MGEYIIRKHIINGTTMKTIGCFNLNDREIEIEQLKQIYPDVSIDIDGDIVVFEDE